MGNDIVKKPRRGAGLKRRQFFRYIPRVWEGSECIIVGGGCDKIASEPPSLH